MTDVDVVTNLDYCNNFHIFALDNRRDMEASIIRIGNSRGIIIPAAILKKLGLGDGSKVVLEEKDGSIIMKAEEPFNGPFTGPFKPLARYLDKTDNWGEDPCNYVLQLRDESKEEKRIIPDW